MKFEDSHWRRALFVVGIIGGLGLAGLSALTGGGDDRDTLPPGAIARVNDVVILRANFAQALSAASADKQNPIPPDQETAVLQRLIEEEILVQRALDMQLAQQDPALRKALINALTEDVKARSQIKPVSAFKLRDYYFKNKARFARPARLFVRAVFIPNANSSAQIAAFEQALSAGETSKKLALRFFGENTSPLPEGLTPADTLKDHIGQAAFAAVENLGTGQWSDWVESDAGFWRLYLVNRTRARSPEFETVRDQVEAAYREERVHDAIRVHLDRLKRNSKITLSADAPQ